jgi:hypothetical protein
VHSVIAGLGDDIVKKSFVGAAAFALFTGGGVFLHQTSAQDASSTQRYLPEYNDKAEMLLPLPKDNADGSRTEPSGRGYFPGKFNGADVTVKDTKRYADTGGCGYYNFNHFEPKAKTAMVKSKDECSYCHQASAKKDEVWTQFYPRLDQ